MLFLRSPLLLDILPSGPYILHSDPKLPSISVPRQWQLWTASTSKSKDSWAVERIIQVCARDELSLSSTYVYNGTCGMTRKSPVAIMHSFHGCVPTHLHPSVVRDSVEDKYLQALRRMLEKPSPCALFSSPLRRGLPLYTWSSCLLIYLSCPHKGHRHDCLPTQLVKRALRIHIYNQSVSMRQSWDYDMSIQWSLESSLE